MSIDYMNKDDEAALINIGIVLAVNMFNKGITGEEADVAIKEILGKENIEGMRYTDILYKLRERLYG